MDISGMIQKWSSRPKAREHEAARVRDNQRRCRARAKAYVADLERQLAETHERLEEALARNATLVSELEELREAVSRRRDVVDYDNSSIPSTDAVGGSEDPILSTPTRQPRSSSPQTSAPLAAAGRVRRRAPPYPVPRGGVRSSAPPSVPPEQCDMGFEPPGLVACGDCPCLPPPAPGESTMPCAAAYDILRQQNYGGPEVEVGLHGSIGRLLRPGFRRAPVPGGGCRVETNRVYSALDAISSL